MKRILNWLRECYRRYLDDYLRFFGVEPGEDAWR